MVRRHHPLSAAPKLALLAAIVVLVSIMVGVTASAAAPLAQLRVPSAKRLPEINGTTAVGGRVRAEVGSWSSGATFSYLWSRCDRKGGDCRPIRAARSRTFKVTKADAGRLLRVTVTATNRRGAATATSKPTAPVAAAQVASGSTQPSAAPASSTEPGSAGAPGSGTASQSTPPVAGGAPPATVRRFGASSGWRLPWLSDADRVRYLDSVKAMGTQMVRFDVNWPSIQHGGPNSYDWAPFDRVVNDLQARGIEALGLIAYTPVWARPAGTNDKHPPTDVGHYANFCEAAARHFAPMGVHHWEVWNEPNIAAFFQPAPDVVKYTAMLKACYARIKAVDPGATVVTGGTSPAGTHDAPCGATACTSINTINFLQGIYANGGGDSFDAVGHHPYTFPGNPSFAAIWSAWHQMAGTSPSLRSVMTANGDGHKKIWATEWGAPTNGPLGSGFVSEALQASQVTEAFQLFGSYSWSGPLFVYNFQDDGTSADTRDNHFGLIRADFSAKPAFAAYRQAALG